MAFQIKLLLLHAGDIQINIKCSSSRQWCENPTIVQKSLFYEILSYLTSCMTMLFCDFPPSQTMDDHFWAEIAVAMTNTGNFPVKKTFWNISMSANCGIWSWNWTQTSKGTYEEQIEGIFMQCNVSFSLLWGHRTLMINGCTLEEGSSLYIIIKTKFWNLFLPPYFWLKTCIDCLLKQLRSGGNFGEVSMK